VRLPRFPAFHRPSLTLPTIRGRRVTWPVATGVVAGALALGMGAAWAWSALSADAVAASAAPTASPRSSDSASPSPAAISAPSIAPGDIIATAAVETIGIYSAPGDPTPASTLTKWSAYGSPRTLLVTDTTGLGDVEWLKVALPVQPNGTTGWILATDVTTSATDLSIHVFLDERTLELRRGDEILLTTPVVIGADETPTPTGLFYVTDPLDFSANPTGVYGAYALGLSGFSNVLKTFDGGPPQIAIHGTNNPALLGTAASNGCIRLPNVAVLELAHAVGLGTPVYVAASRADA
jgi:lipoprotein-anchoring transpeptidase ErfK/SrfK